MAISTTLPVESHFVPWTVVAQRKSTRLDRRYQAIIGVRDGMFRPRRFGKLTPGSLVDLNRPGFAGDSIP